MTTRQNFSAPPDIADEEINIADLLGIIIKNRWIIAGIAVFSLLIGTVYYHLATPIYKSDGLLQVEEKNTGLADLDINSLFESDASISAEIQILKSRSVLGAVVDNLQIDILVEPDFFPVIGAALARSGSKADIPVLKVDSLEVPERWMEQRLSIVALEDDEYKVLSPDGELIMSGRVGTPAETILDDGERLALFVSRMQAESEQVFFLRKVARQTKISDLQRNLSVVERGERSGILSISLEGNDPASITEQVNEIADVYVRQNVERKSAEAQKTLEFLDRQLPSVRQTMEAAELALNSYRLEKGSIDLPLETRSILETIVNVEGRLNELQQEREKILQAYTSAHPIVVGLDRQIDRLTSELNDLNDQVRDLPTTQQEVLRLIRDVEVNTVLYTTLLNTAQELRVVKAGTVGNVRVIDYAVVPERPIKPNKSRILLLSLFFGGFSGIATAFIRHAITGGVDDPDLIESRFGIPVYATIPHSSNQDKLYRDLQGGRREEAILASSFPDDPAIESLRNLRTALYFGMIETRNNCIMIAGPSPQIGKSFASTNLAAVLASQDRKILIIDGDMRRGHLHRYLGRPRKNGLSELLTRKSKLEQVIQTTTVRNLDFISTGAIPENPSEILHEKQFEKCLQELIPRYDYIIIDAPPVMAVTDATIIGQLVGGVLMVLQAGDHPLREIEQSIKRFNQSGIKVDGLIFNNIDLRSRHYGAGKYSYQYTYG